MEKMRHRQTSVVRTKRHFAAAAPMAAFARLLNAVILYDPSCMFSPAFEEPFLCKRIVNEQSGKTVAWSVSWINCVDIDGP